MTKTEATKHSHSHSVVMWRSPAGETLTICRACEARLEGDWPRDSQGSEFCSVSHGIHRGECELALADA